MSCNDYHHAEVALEYVFELPFHQNGGLFLDRDTFDSEHTIFPYVDLDKIRMTTTLDAKRAPIVRTITLLDERRFALIDSTVTGNHRAIIKSHRRYDSR